MAKTKNLRLRKTFWWGDDGKVFCSLAFRVFWWVDPTFLQRVRTWRARARRWWRHPGSCRWSSAPPPHQLAAADSRSQRLKTIISGNVQWDNENTERRCWCRAGRLKHWTNPYDTQRLWMRFWGAKIVASFCTHLGPAQVMEVIIIGI